jgi:Secretion system C-terminal sorting domain
MNRIPIFRFAIAFLLLLGGLPVIGQQTFTIASNLPPRLVASAGVSLQTPQNIFDPFDLAPNAFHSGGSGSYTVLWTPSLGLNDPALLSPTVTFVTPSAQGQYVMTVTDGNGCIVRDTVAIDFATGLKDGHAWQLSLTLAPNPSNGTFELFLAGQPSNEPMLLRITDPMGRVVASVEEARFTGQLSRRFDLAHLHAGVYFLAVQTGQKRAVRAITIH